jgi:hypothetical protein
MLAVAVASSLAWAISSGSAGASAHCQRTSRDLLAREYKRLVVVYQRRNLTCWQATGVSNAVDDAYERGLPVADYPPLPGGVPGGQGQPFRIHPVRYGTYTCSMTERGSDFVSARCTGAFTGARFVRFTAMNHAFLWASSVCGSFHQQYLLTAIKVRVLRGKTSCAVANRVMHKLFAGGQNRTIDGWHCIGPQTGHAACTKGTNKITATF